MVTVCHIVTGLADGGAEAVLFRLTTTDDRHRHVVVSLGGRGKYGPLLEEQGIRVLTLDMPRGQVTPGGVHKLFSVLRAEKPQLVQTWMYHANLLGGAAARLSGVRRVFWGIHHSTLVPGTTGASTRLVDWICARLSRAVPIGIIACAVEAQRAHVANGYDASKFTVIPNGYDVSLFAPDLLARARIRAELGIADQSPLVGLVGRWDPQKDHANLIAAFQVVTESFPELHLILAGTGCVSENEELAQLLRAKGVSQRVHLLGRRTDVPALMNALDLHVLSSYSEAFPNVVAEAMACGTPCVVTDVGDASLIVGPTGWVVPPKDPQALATAIADSLNEIGNVEQWKIRKAAARDRIVGEFSLDVMVERYRAAWLGK